MNYKITGTLLNKQVPVWPPKIGSIIIIEHPMHPNNLFLGSINKYLWECTAIIVLLFNNRNHEEKILEDKNVVPIGKSKGLFMLLPQYKWSYVKMEKLQQLFKGDTNIDSTKLPIMQSDLTTEAIYYDESKRTCVKSVEKRDDSLLNDAGNLKMEELFTDKEINMKIFNTGEPFTNMDGEIKILLLRKLELNEKIKEKNMEIIVNDNTINTNIINNKKDEISEGNKIIKWINENISSKTTNEIKIFGDLKMGVFNGYVHIARLGINTNDNITTELIPKLNFFKWQYNIPIDYDTLKYTLFQSTFQTNIKRDVTQQKEAEEIFSQEYLIALQPEPKYQIWALKRLIIAWHADDYLQLNIRKIKVIINQWRCKSNEEFNTKYGALPSIVVYPRYGKKSASIVLKRISNYFTFYNSIAWKCAIPSYFVKVTDLLWYTNGNIDLKLYFRKSLIAYDGKTSNKTFIENYSSINGSERLVYPFIK
jgi:hypothetical protein